MMKIVKKIILFLFILLNFSSHTLAEDVQGRLDAANGAHSRGEYEKAISLYQGILEQEGLSSAVLYNLANTYAQKGEVGMAVLSYERALRISPSDPDIVGNLAKVRKDSGLFMEEKGKIEQLVAKLSIDSWVLLGLSSFSLMLVLLFLRLRVKPAPRPYFAGWAGAVLTLVFSITAVAYGSQNYDPLVVVADNAKLQISPFAGASSSGSIEEGRLLFPLKTHGDYIYVTDRAGRKGWLVQEAAISVCQSI